MGTPAGNLFGSGHERGCGLDIPQNPEVSVAEWIGGLRITQGDQAGKPFHVLPWQRAFLDDALAPGVQQAALSVARGNGKTTLVAALAGAFLDGPLRQPRAEVPVVAASYAQARIAFEHVRGFLDERLFPKAHWRITDSLNWSIIEHRPTRARLRVMSSNPKRAHGLAPALVICDEPAQWQVADGERMFSALVTSMGKIAGSRLIALGTRPANGDHWFARLLASDGDGVVSHCHAASAHADIGDRAEWLRANPSLEYMPHLERAIAIEARQCESNPAMLPAFRALRLNQGISDADTVEKLVEVDDWLRCEARDGEARGPSIWGVDMGGSMSMSAVACFWPQTGRLDAIAEVGSQPNLASRGMADGVGTLYEQAYAMGQLSVSEKRIPDTAALLRRALEKWGAPVVVVCDRWRLGELADAGEAVVPNVEVVPRGQGFREGAEDVRRFRGAVKLADVKPAGKLVLLQAGLADACVVSDPSGNWKLAKQGHGRGRKSRDDVVAAAILAVAHGVRVADNEQAPSAAMHEIVW